MAVPRGLTEGFALKVFALDNETIVYINVCGHDSVGLPMTKNMNPIPSPAYLDEHGVENLIIPISIGHPTFFKKEQQKNGTPTVVVDAVIHPELVKRATEAIPRHKNFISDNRAKNREGVMNGITTLVLNWVTQEAGLQLIPQSVRLWRDGTLPYHSHHKKGDETMPTEDEKQYIKARAEALYEQMMKEMANSGGVSGPPGKGGPPSFDNEAGSKLPSELLLNSGTATSSNNRPTATTQQQQPPIKKPLIVEMNSSDNPTPQSTSTASSSSSSIRKGFLCDSKGAGKLYGDKGTSEGVLPDGAGDPLGYLPKSLRSRCQIVDTRPEAQQQQQKPAFGSAMANGAKAAATNNASSLFGGVGDIGGEEFLSQLAAISGVGPSPSSVASAPSAAVSTAAATTLSTPAPSVTTTSTTSSAPPPPPPPVANSEWLVEQVVDPATVAPHRSVAVRLSHPSVQSMTDVADLSVEDQGTVLEVNGHRVVLPFAVDEEDAKAKFVKSTKTLVVTLKEK